jgi:release factor glutamine methyltransferase
MTSLSGERRATLLEVGRALRRAGYVFVTPTPETHRRVLSREPGRAAMDARDIFGWNRRFDRATGASLLSRLLFDRCVEVGVFVPVPAGSPSQDSAWLSRVRFATLDEPTGEHLFIHSSFPTDDVDSVFFGPDSYRFAALLSRTVTHARRVVDLGCGSGVGGLVLAKRAEEVILADLNVAALEHAAINVALAGADRSVSVRASDLLADVEDGFDLVVANPPYIVDDAERLYRNGGGLWGIDLAFRIVEESLARLPAGGRLILYTGTPIRGGRSLLAESLRPLVTARAATWQWQELDPDVFGEELERPAYRDIERLALVALEVTVS